MNTVGSLRLSSIKRARIRYEWVSCVAGFTVGVGIGEGSEKKPRRDWKGLHRGEVGIGPLVYSLSIMVPEGENECPRVSGLLLTCPFSFYISLMVGKGRSFKERQGGQVQILGTGIVLIRFGVEAIFTSDRYTGRIFFCV